MPEMVGDMEAQEQEVQDERRDMESYIDAVPSLGGMTSRRCSRAWLSSESNLTAAHNIRSISMPAGCFSSIRETRCGPSEYLAHEEENASSVECSLWVERLEQVVASQEDGLYALPFCIHFWRVDVSRRALGVQDSSVPHPVTSRHKITYSLPPFYY